MKRISIIINRYICAALLAGCVFSVTAMSDKNEEITEDMDTILRDWDSIINDWDSIYDRNTHLLDSIGNIIKHECE